MNSFIHTYWLCKHRHPDKTHHHKCTFHCLRMKHSPHTGQLDLGYSCCPLIFLINHPEALCQMDQSMPEYESYNVRQNHYNVAHKQFHFRIYAQTISQYALVQTIVTSDVETENVRQAHRGPQTARSISALIVSNPKYHNTQQRAFN